MRRPRRPAVPAATLRRRSSGSAGREDRRLDQLTLFALAVCGTVGYVAAFLALSEQPYFHANPLQLALLGVCLYLLPLIHGWITRSWSRGWLRAFLECISISLQVGLLAALTLLGLVETGLSAAVLMLGYGLCTWKSTPHGIGTILISLTLPHLARSLVPGDPTTYLLLLSFPSAALALSCVQSRHTRRSGLRVRPERAHPVESRRSLAARFIGATMASVACLAIALLTHHLTNVPPGSSGEAADTQRPDTDNTEERPPGDLPAQPREGQPLAVNGRDETGQPGDRPPDTGGKSGEGEREQTEDEKGTLPRDAESMSGNTPPSPGEAAALPPPNVVDLLQSMIDPNHPGIRYVAVPDYAKGRFNAAAEELERNPWKLILAILSQLIILLWIFRRRVRRRLAGRGFRLPGVSRSDFYFDKLLRVLESYGHSIRESEPPREFTRGIIRARGRFFEPCSEITDLLYRSRYGGQDLTPEERRHIEQILQRLGNRELT